MIRYTITAPQCYNNGMPIDPDIRRAWQIEAGLIAGGATLLPTCEGLWTDERIGVEYNEAVDVILIDAGEGHAEAVRELAKRIKAEAKQAFVYVTAQPILVEFV